MRVATTRKKVIRKMAVNIQPPDPERFKWERHTAVVRGAGDWSSRNPSERGSSALPEGDGSGREVMGALDDADVLQSFWSVIADAAADENMMVPWPSAPSAAGLLQQVRTSPPTLQIGS